MPKGLYQIVVGKELLQQSSVLAGKDPLTWQVLVTARWKVWVIP